MGKLIIANWKMNPRTRREAEELARASDVEGLIICPPFVFIDDVSRMISRARLGAQDVFWEEWGAYTGEVSLPELQDLGVEYVIVGHSERRQNLGETDEMVARKIAAAIKAGITAVLCIGETRIERDAGQTEAVVKRQLQIGLSKLINSSTTQLIIAYEPIWAIGTGTPDTPEDMISMVKLIKNQVSGIKYQVIYGGSVTSKNAESFLKHSEIEGVLVGGASLRSEEIKKILEIANKYKG